MSRRLFAHAVDADVTGLDERGSRGAGLHHPRVPQPFIETLPLQLSFRSLFLTGFPEREPVSTPIKSGQAFSKTLSLLLAVARKLFLQRRQFCKWRIGIDGTIALARRRAGRPLTVRGAAIALAALVASAEITAAALALVAATTLVAVALVAIELVAAVVIVAALALDALAGRTVLTHFSRRRALNCRRRSHSIRRRALAGFTKLVVAAAAAMALLARRALGAFASRGWRAFGRAAVMALAVAVVMRAALLGTATGPPDFDEHRLSRCIGLGFCGRRFGSSGFSNSGFRWCGLAGRGRLGRGFRRACRFNCRLFSRRFSDRGFCRRLCCGFNRRSLDHRRGRFADRRDIGQQ